MEIAPDGGYVIINSEGIIIKTDAYGEILWENNAGAGKREPNEMFSFRPVGQADDGYLIAWEKSTFEQPLAFASHGLAPTSPLVSQHLIVTKFDLNGKEEWEKTRNIPMKE